MAQRPPRFAASARLSSSRQAIGSHHVDERSLVHPRWPLAEIFPSKTPDSRAITRSSCPSDRRRSRAESDEGGWTMVREARNLDPFVECCMPAFRVKCPRCCFGPDGSARRLRHLRLFVESSPQIQNDGRHKGRQRAATATAEDLCDDRSPIGHTVGSEITPVTTHYSRVASHPIGKLRERNARQKPPSARLMMLPRPPPLRRNQPGRSS
jgi:hypothetical protein